MSLRDYIVQQKVSLLKKCLDDKSGILDNELGAIRNNNDRSNAKKRLTVNIVLELLKLSDSAWEFIKNTSKLPWDWVALSRNENISWEFVKQNMNSIITISL